MPRRIEARSHAGRELQERLRRQVFVGRDQRYLRSPMTPTRKPILGRRRTLRSGAGTGSVRDTAVQPTPRPRQAAPRRWRRDDRVLQLDDVALLVERTSSRRSPSRRARRQSETSTPRRPGCHRARSCTRGRPRCPSPSCRRRPRRRSRSGRATARRSRRVGRLAAPMARQQLYRPDAVEGDRFASQRRQARAAAPSAPQGGGLVDPSFARASSITRRDCCIAVGLIPPAGEL